MGDYKSPPNLLAKLQTMERRLAALELSRRPIEMWSTTSLLATSTPILVTNPPFTIVAQVGPIPSLAVGDYVLVTCDMEVTNAFTYNIDTDTQVMQCVNPGDTTGTYAIRSASQNITPANHHQLESRSCGYVVSNASRNIFSFMVAAASSSAGVSDTLTIESLPSQVLLSVLHIKPNG